MIVSLTKRLLSSARGDGLKAQLVRGALGVGGLRLLSLPLTFAASVLLARGLGPEGYGQYVFVLTVISILALPVAQGLGQLVTREVAKYHLDEEWELFGGLLRRAHQWVSLGSCIIAAILTLFVVRNASWAVDDRWTLLFIATLMLPLLGFNALRSAALAGLRQVFYAQLPDMLARPGLHLLITGGLLLTGMLNPATALASQIAATSLAFGVGATFLWRLRPAEVNYARHDFRHGEWGRALLPITLLAVAGTFNGQIGVLALGWLGSDEDVAALQVAMSGAMLVGISLSIINGVISPHITRAHRANDKDRLQRLSRQSGRAALAVALPIALPLIFFGGPIVQFVYGEAYRDTAPLPLAILAAGQLIHVAFGSVDMLLTMSGYERDTLKGHLMALLINVILAVVLIPSLGAVGAALAVAVGLTTWNTVLGILCVRRLSVWPSAL